MAELPRLITTVYLASRNSWGGRIVFVLHLCYTVLFLKFYILVPFALPRLLFALINLPQLVILHLFWDVIGTESWRWIVFGIFTSIPWWAYGVAAEFAIKRRLRISDR